MDGLIIKPGNLLFRFTFNGNCYNWSNSSKNGTAVGSPSYGADPAGIILNGSSQYVTTEITNFQKPMTIIARFKTPTASQLSGITDWKALAVLGFSARNNGLILGAQKKTGSEVALFTSNLGYSNIGYYTAGIVPDTWYQFAYTYASDQTFIEYINGKRVNSRTLTGSQIPGSTGAAVYIGAEKGTAVGSYFPGTVSSVRGYNTVLTGNEIAVIYHSSRPGMPL